MIEHAFLRGAQEHTVTIIAPDGHELFSGTPEQLVEQTTDYKQLIEQIKRVCPDPV